MFAFQLLVILLPSAKVKVTDQPLTALLPGLLMRIAPVKPVFHSLLKTNWHLSAAGLLLDDELLVDVAGTELLVLVELEVLVAGLDDEVAVDDDDDAMQ